MPEGTITTPDVINNGPEMSLHPGGEFEIEEGGIGSLRAEVLSDRPIVTPNDDRLGFTAYADALAEVIDTSGTVTPLTISIDAPWGAGKTSLARLVEHNLREWPKDRGDPPHIICWFNAWLHADAPKLGPALAAAVGRTLARERPLALRILNPLPSAMLTPSERWHRRLILGFVALVLTGLAFLIPAIFHSLLPKPSSWGPLTKLTVGTGVLAAIPLGVSTWKSAFSTAQAAAAFVDDPKSQAATGAMSDVVAQFSKLVTSATRRRRRLVIFVDDLERCQPDNAVEVCEIANLLLAQRDVVTVLIGDLSALRKYAQEKAPESADVDASYLGRGDDRGHNYLDKIIQLEFTLPRLDQGFSTEMLDASTAYISSEHADARAGAAASPPSGGDSARVGRPVRRGRPRRHWIIRSVDISAGTGKRYAIFLGVLVGIFFAASVVLGAADPNFSSSDNSWGNTVVVWVFVLEFVLAILVGIVGMLRRSARRKELRRTTAKVDREFSATIGAPGTGNVPKIDEAVSQYRQATEGDKARTRASSSLVKQRARRLIVAQHFGPASTEMKPFLPPLPRGIKRAANRLYLLVSVAVSRGMLGGEVRPGGLTPQHVGKWSVLLDRWPELAEAIMSDLSLAERLEAGVDGSVPELRSDKDLLRFWNGNTKIGPVIEQLVSALPARPVSTATAVQAPEASIPPARA